jgi:hypothetical protein
LLATPAPSAREIPLRDVRDLALAVIEGAVAAEALANELRRTPDRSAHFREIAERLRGVVGRASIRAALADDRARTFEVVPTVRFSAPPLVPRPSPAPERGERRVEAPEPIARDSPPNASSQVAEAVVRALPMHEVSLRLARIEHSLSDATTRERGTADARDEQFHAAIARIERAIGELARKTPEQAPEERTIVASAADAIALAGLLVERLNGEETIAVRIESPARR